LAPELTGVDVAVLVEARGEHHVELATGILDVPGTQRVLPAVVPAQFGAQLGEPPVDDQAVLGEAGALRPLGPHLQADDVVATATGATAPVPADLRRPPASADVEHPPRLG